MDVSELGIDTPSTLQGLCIEIILTHIEYIAEKSEDSRLQLKPGLKLSLPICEKLMQGLQEMLMLTVETISLFRDNTRTRLKYLNLSGLCSTDVVTDPIIQDLLKHKPHKIEILGFKDEASLQTLETLYNHSDNLTSLCVGPKIVSHLNLTKNFPKLRSLGLRQVNIDACLRATENPHRLVCLVEDIASLGHQLVYLDFSLCDINFVNCDLAFSKLQNLRSLILHGVYINKQKLPDAVKAISRLNNLRLLDLSVANHEGPYLYENPEVNLRNLSENLPLLTHLDISGTNLASCDSHDDVDEDVSNHAASDVNSKCSIPGLKGRHLDFLGLMNCKDHACERTNLPANMITGHFTEEQVLLSVQTYTDRGGHMLDKALHNLFELLRHEKCHDLRRALHTLVNALARHPMDSGIQISGSACLFFIISDKMFCYRNTHLQRRIVRILIAAMETHDDEQKMLRNGSLIIQYLEFPKDALSLLQRFVQVLLDALLRHNDAEGISRRACIDTLEFIICRLNVKEMQLVVELATTEVLLEVIKELVLNEVCDHVMEIAWRILWWATGTDENQTTSQRFVDNEGMTTFYQCYQTFPTTNTLLRSMAGVLNNVAEIPTLRSYLVTSEYITALSHMLSVDDGDIEISYLTCATLAYIISDGPSAWNVETPTRESVLKEMTTAINKWQLKTEVTFNYSSLEPLLRLLKPESDLQSHLFVVWAICNLTKTTRSTYCPMVEREGGLDLLKTVSQNVTHCETVRHLAKEVIDRCRRFQEDPGWRTDDEE